MKLWRRIILGALIFVILILGAIELLVRTNVGLHTLFYIVHRSVPELKIDHISGNLHNLHLKNIHYHHSGIAISASEFHLKTQFNFFFSRKLCVNNILLKNIIVFIDSKKTFPNTLSPSKNSNENGLLYFFLSYPIVFYKITINNIHIKINNIIISVAHFNSGLRWKKRNLTLTSTLIQEVLISMKKKKFIERNAQFLQLEKRLLEDKLHNFFSRRILPEIDNTIDYFRINLNIEEFRVRRVHLIGNTHFQILNILVKLSFLNKNINLKVFNIDTNLGSIHASANGMLYDNWPVNVFINSVLNINSLKNEKINIKINGVLQEKLNFLVNLSGPMNLTCHGQTQLAKVGIPFNCKVFGSHFSWLFSSEKQFQADDIKLKLIGKASNYRFSFYTVIKGRNISPATILISAKGNKQQIKINKLIVKTLDGGKAKLEALINWNQTISWYSNLKLINFNTIKILPICHSKLSGIIKAKGSIYGKSWQIDFPKIKVVGNIEQNKIKINGSLKGDSFLQWIVPNLQMMLGHNTVNIKGELGVKKLNLDTFINASNLNNILLNVHGTVKGMIRIRGTKKSPKLLTNIIVSSFHWKNLSVNRIQIYGAIQSIKQILGKFTLQIEQIIQSKTYAHLVTLIVKGSEKQHDLQFYIQGNSISGKLHFIGSFNRQKEFWKGQLDNIQIDTPIGPLAVSRIISLEYHNFERKIRIGPHCWNNSNIGFCLLKTIDVGIDEGHAIIDFNHFNLAVLKYFLPNTTKASGMFSGQVNTAWGIAEAKSTYFTKVKLLGHAVRVAKIVNKVPTVVTFDTIKLNADLNKNFVQFEWFSKITNNSFLAGKMQINNLQKKRKIRCNINIHNLDISIANVVLLSNQKAIGFLNANLLLEGDAQNPHVYGQMHFSDINVSGDYIPFDMKSSKISLNFNGMNSTLKGEVHTARGKIHLTGNASWNQLNKWKAYVVAKGSRVRITIPPIVQLDVSPNIALKAEPHLLLLKGKIDVPWARFLIRNVPENTLDISGDEVLLDESLQPTKQRHVKIPLNANLTIHLGSDVRLDAFSLKTRMNGDLKFIQDKRGLGLNGQINILDGRLYAYGQDLIIRKSELLFSGPLDQLALHIEAIRNPDSTEGNVIAGVRITGSSDNPKVEIFSDPVMSQQAALSYLLCGQEFSSDQKENVRMTSMLVGIGVAQSSKIVGKIGKIFGISNLMLDTYGVGNSSQIVISGYVLPDLQVKYGIRIFDSLTTLILRYRLMPNLYLEAISGVDQTLDLLYQFKF